MLGSPPLVRGKVDCRILREFEPGITPACAGKSFSYLSDGNKDKDHPRLCGEKIVQFLLLLCLEGSPPLVRGKDVPTGNPIGIGGITPACAGKRCCKILGLVYARDHPRLCGEK